MTRVERAGGRVTGVTTACGRTVRADHVVVCCGMWTRQFAEQACGGAVVPLQAAEHYYLLTGAMPEVDADWPVIEDPENYTYIRPEGGGLMVGLFEGEGAAWEPDAIPPQFSFGEIEPDWDRLAPYLERAMARVPATLEAPVRKLFCGPESFTPDGAPAVGPLPELEGLWTAAGLNSIGILTGGGVGRALARWVTTGRPDVDVTGIHVGRLGAWQSTPDFRRARVREQLGETYKVHYPAKAKRTGRGAKRSPLHDRLAAQGAFFRDVSGWECPDWYAGAGATRARLRKWHTN